MPDSPADVKTQSRSTPPNMPPPSPAVSQGATRHPTFTSNPSEYPPHPSGLSSREVGEGDLLKEAWGGVLPSSQFFWALLLVA